MSQRNSQRPKGRQRGGNGGGSSLPAPSAPAQNVAPQEGPVHYDTGLPEPDICSQAPFNPTTQMYMQYYQQFQLQQQQQQQLQSAYMPLNVQRDSEWDMPQEPFYQDAQPQFQGQVLPVQNAPYMNAMPMFTPQFQPLPYMNPFSQSHDQSARHFSSSAEPYTLPATTYVPPEGLPTDQTGARSRQKPPSPRQITPPVAPVPTTEYQEQTSIEPVPTTSPKSLLVILDVNGTLICRRRRGFPPSFTKRPGLDAFFEYLFANFKVMIWTSSQPKTVQEVLNRLLKPADRKKLVGVWARDTLDLSKEQYREKVQVYKRLDKVWDDKAIQSAYPRRKSKNNKDGPKRWNQTNTILIDDSALKAVSQPHNIIEIPEFTNDPEVDEEKNLRTVMRQLKILSYQADVSRKLRQWADRRHEGATTVNPDAVDSFWGAELEAEEAVLATRIGGLDQGDEEDGGVRCSDPIYEANDTGDVQAAVVDAQRLISEELRISNESEDNKEKGPKMSKSQKRAVRRRRAEAAMKGKKKQ